jgi:hypothetical protein
MKAAVPRLNERALADALACAAMTDFRREPPGRRAKAHWAAEWNPLETLVHVGGVPSCEVLRVGLAVLPTLADLCRSDSVSVLRAVA